MEYGHAKPGETCEGGKRKREREEGRDGLRQIEEGARK